MRNRTVPQADDPCSKRGAAGWDGGRDHGDSLPCPFPAATRVLVQPQLLEPCRLQAGLRQPQLGPPDCQEGKGSMNSRSVNQGAGEACPPLPGSAAPKANKS